MREQFSIPSDDGFGDGHQVRDEPNPSDEGMAQASHWESLIEDLLVQSETAAADERVSLLRTAASLFEDQIGDFDSAFVTLEAALVDANGTSPEILLHMERLAARTGRWQELDEAAARTSEHVDSHEACTEDYVELLERRADRVASEDEWVALMMKVAALWEAPLRRRDRAAQTLQKVLAAAPANETAVRTLERLYRETNDFRPLVALLARQSANASSQDERAELAWKRAAVAERLGAQDLVRQALEEAVAAWPAHDEAALALAALEERAGNCAEAVRLLEACAERAAGTARADLHVRAGTLAESRLGDVRRAEACFRAAVAADPHHGGAAVALAAIARARGTDAQAAAAIAVAARASHGPTRVTLLLEAAALEQSSDDSAARERAYELAAEALEEDAKNETALQILSELSLELGEPGAALRFTEALLSHMPAGAAKRARTHLRAANAALALDDQLKARAHLGRALHGSSGAELWADVLSWARSTAAEKRWREAGVIFEALFEHRPAHLPGPEAADLCFWVGTCRGHLTDDGAAIPLWKNALQFDPSHRGARRALAAAHVARGDARAAVDQKRALLDRAVDEDEAFTLLSEMAELLRTKLDSPGLALAAIERALAIRPNDRAALHEAMELYAQAHKWQESIDALQRLAGLGDVSMRARYLVAAGDIRRVELRQHDEALDLYEQALALDPEDEKAFERVERMLSERNDLAGLCRLTTRTAEILEQRSADAPACRGRAADLWQAAAELNRRIGDRSGAIAAYERAAALVPDAAMVSEALAALHAETGPEGRARAMAMAELAFAEARDDRARAAAVRAARAVCLAAADADRAHVLLSVLLALGAATDSERTAYEQARPRPAQRTLSAKAQAQLFAFTAAEVNVSRVFAVVSNAVAFVRAHDKRSLKANKNADASAPHTAFGRAYESLRQVVFEDAPAFHLHPEEPGAAALLGVRDRDKIDRVLSVRAGLLQPCQESELLFRVALRVSLLQPAQAVLWPTLVESDGERHAILLAAGRLLHPALEAPPELALATQQYTDLFRAAVPASALDHLASIDSSVFQSTDEAALERWRKACVRGAARVALLVCGDVRAALRALASEGDDTLVSFAPALRDDLLAFAVSEAHMALRKELGLSVS